MFSRLIRKLTEPRKSSHRQDEVKKTSSKKETGAFQGFALSLKERIHQRSWLVITVLLFLTLFVSTQVRSFVYVAAFVALAAMSKLIQLFFPHPLVVGLDLISVLLVVLTVAYGPLLGISLALVAYYAGNYMLSFSGRRTDPATYIVPPLGYFLTGIAVSLLGYGFPEIGYTSMFIYAASVTVMFSLYYGSGAVIPALSFLTTYFLFHYWIYSSYAQTILDLFI